MAVITTSYAIKLNQRYLVKIKMAWLAVVL